MLKKNSIIYQVYPLTFNAPDGGYGTLKGVIDKLDYIKDTDADAIWLSPFFESPLQKGFGYNVKNYKDIEKTFGDMEDCKKLISEAHKRGISVVFDLVFNHTSDQHEWFEASRDPKNPQHEKYKDYYVWADGKNGRPPNNWQSVASLSDDNSAWKYDGKRKQYFLHNFADNMPDLNLTPPPGQPNPVLEELKGVVKFWVDQGVDGFRLDAIPYLAHNPALTDTTYPASKVHSLKFEHQVAQEQTSHVLAELNKTAKEAGRAHGKEVLFIGEGWLPSPTPAVLAKAERTDFVAGYDYGVRETTRGAVDQMYTGVFGGHAGCITDGSMRNEMTLAAQAFKGNLSGMDLATDNHDMSRAVQRWGLLPQGKGWTPERQHKYAKLIGKMKLSMPGSLTVFQGEELGLPDADVAKYLKRNNNSSKWDEQALAQYLSDYEGCRGMMPWTGKQVAADNGWVGTPPEYAQFTPDRNPTLEAYKKFIRFRKDSEPLLNGDIEMLHDDHKNVIAFTRTAPDGEKLFCAFNFGPRAVGVTSPDGLKVKLDPVDCYIGDARIKRTWEEMGGAARNA